MATITNYITHQMDVEDKRDIRENLIRDKVILKTNSRVTWTTLRTMSPVPKWGDSHPREKGFYLDYIKPVHKSRLVWELELEYTPYKGGQIDPDPLARPADVTFSSSLIELPTFFDYKRRPMTTTAGEFISGIVESIPLIEYSITKNLGQDPAWLLTHLGAVNADPIKLRGRTWAPKTVLFSAVSAGPYITENRSLFSEFRLTLLADPRTWTKEVWNRGTVQLELRQRVTDSGIKSYYRQVQILEGDPPEPVQEPVPLDENGFVIDSYLQKDRTEPIKPGLLIKLNFETQHPRTFTNVLPLT